MPQTEITEPVPALDETGCPRNFGWARAPFFAYDHRLVNAAKRRVSEGDRYILFSPGHTVLFEILDDGYLGYVFASVASLRDKKRSTQTFVTPFSLGSFDLPGSSETGAIKFSRKTVMLNFAAMEGGARIIKADIPKNNHRHSIRGEVVLTPPPGAESLVTHLPFRGKDGAFSSARRSPCYFAEGVIQFGASELVFTRGTGWGVFDWGRGVRPHSDLRFWAVGSGQAGDRHAAFSVGFSTADSGAGTENAFFIDGRLHKLDQVSFHIPAGRLEPWRFTSNDNRLEMSFTPHQERDETHQMFMYSLNRRQAFGSFSGRVILDSGEEFEFHHINGMTERRKSRL